MMRRSLQYYTNTVSLKTAAKVVCCAEALGLLKNYQANNQKKFQAWFEADFGNNQELLINSPSDTFFSYAFLQDPRELYRLMVFDGNGAPLGWKHAKPTAPNPLMASYIALSYFNHYRASGQVSSKKDFLFFADFLAAHGKIDNGGFWLPYHQPVPKFGIQAPWYSGLAQAVAMSVFIRAFHLTDKQIYLEKVNLLYQTLNLPVERGGFLEATPEGQLWVQEYPTLHIRFVLNGFVLCLICLFEYLHFIGNKLQLKDSVRNLTASLFDNLHHFIFGGYTKYARNRHYFSNIEYQGLYVFMFLHLFKLSGKWGFLQLAKHFHLHTEWSAFFTLYGIEDYHNRLPAELDQS